MITHRLKESLGKCLSIAKGAIENKNREKRKRIF
jgi:hypothetical protein